MTASSSSDSTVDSRLFGPVGTISDVRLLPLGDGLLVDAVALGQGPQARLTMLYRSTDRLCRCGAPVENLAHSASFHSGEKNAPSNPGTKHLVNCSRGDWATAFETPAGSSYPPILEMQHLKHGAETVISGPGGAIGTVPFRMIHGDIEALGFRFGRIAYAPDVSLMPDDSMRFFEDLDVLILDALRYTSHLTHLSVSEALELIEKVKPRRAVLTNLHTDLDYEKLRRELPPHIEPAFDGLQIEGP